MKWIIREHSRIRIAIVLPGCFLLTISFLSLSLVSFCQSPEISLREFASGQIKKGVRSIGMGGDGATWGNYALVWRDSSTALADAGLTRYTNGNTFGFTAVGVTTPALWKGLTIYAIALSQYAANITTSLKSAGLGTGAVPVNGDGNNQAFFIKSAMPLGKGFSVGLLLSYERSQFDAVSLSSPANYVRYKTNWVPSGGIGVTWQPNKRILIGLRGLFNQDREIKTDNINTATGLNLAHEYRAGISILVWQDALIDIGGNIRYRHNAIYHTSQTDPAPNIGFEQGLWHKHLFLRAGLDESSGTSGFSVKTKYIILDVAYIYNLGIARIGSLFGTNSNSAIATLTFNYGRYGKDRK